MKIRAVLGAVYGGWVLAVLTIILAPVLFPSELEQFVGNGVPRQYRSELLSEVLADYAGVQGIAHNSGNSLMTAERASLHGADIIEVDVVGVNGRLYASHDGPLPILGSRVFPRPTLWEVWDATAGATLMIDLKEPSASYRSRLLEFLERRGGEREVLVSSRNRYTLEAFERERPEVKRILSISSEAAMRRLAEDAGLLELIDGVSVRDKLLDKDMVSWLRDHDLTVFAWVVNDIERVNALVEWGVDGITTDDLTILDLLGNGIPYYLPDISPAEPAPAGAVSAM